MAESGRDSTISKTNLEVFAWDGNLQNVETVHVNSSGLRNTSDVGTVVIAPSASAATRKRYYILEPLGVWVKRGKSSRDRAPPDTEPLTPSPSAVAAALAAAIAGRPPAVPTGQRKTVMVRPRPVPVPRFTTDAPRWRVAIDDMSALAGLPAAESVSAMMADSGYTSGGYTGSSYTNGGDGGKSYTSIGYTSKGYVSGGGGGGRRGRLPVYPAEVASATSVAAAVLLMPEDTRNAPLPPLKLNDHTHISFCKKRKEKNLSIY